MSDVLLVEELMIADRLIAHVTRKRRRGLG
jgi:hypothetical protein